MEAVSNQGAPSPVVPECHLAEEARETAELPTNDLGAMLLGIVMKSLSQSSNQAMADIDHANTLMERARAEAEAALRRAEAAEDSAGLWGTLKQVFGGDLATLAGVVAATAVVIGSGGTGAMAILALASVGLSTTSTVGSRLGLDPKACAMLATAGALLGVAAGQFGSAGTVSALATGARAVQGASTALGGGAMMVEGNYRGHALDARADQKAAEQKERSASLNIDLALQLLEEAQRDIARSRRATSQIQATEDDARSAVIARMGAA